MSTPIIPVAAAADDAVVKPDNTELEAIVDVTVSADMGLDDDEVLADDEQAVTNVDTASNTPGLACVSDLCVTAVTPGTDGDKTNGNSRDTEAENFSNNIAEATEVPDEHDAASYSDKEPDVFNDSAILNMVRLKSINMPQCSAMT